jgi:hypothetical protein
VTDSRFLASGVFAMSLFAVPGVDVPNVAIEGLTLASGVELKTGTCNEVRVFLRAASTWQGNARVQLAIRESGGELIFSGTRAVVLARGDEQTLVFNATARRRTSARGSGSLRPSSARICGRLLLVS